MAEKFHTNFTCIEIPRAELAALCGQPWDAAMLTAKERCYRLVVPRSSEPTAKGDLAWLRPGDSGSGRGRALLYSQGWE